MFYKVYVPSYNKSLEQLRCLKFLEDDKIELYLCVRDEEYDKYINYATKVNSHRLVILNLGKDITDIGETRRRILDYSIKYNEQYCAMFDDEIEDFYFDDCQFEEDRRSLSLSCIIHRFQSDKLSDRIACFTFYRKNSDWLGVHPSNKYFVGGLVQGFVINNNVIKKYDINFKSTKECGIEDDAFLIDCIKHRLVSIGDTSTNIIGKVPNKITSGGNHVENEDFEKRRDKDQEKLLKYANLKYGVCLEKKYRKHSNCFIAYVRLDYSYFRSILVDEYEEHKDRLDELLGGN